jgi:hypothetical protein
MITLYSKKPPDEDLVVNTSFTGSERSKIIQTSGNLIVD